MAVVTRKTGLGADVIRAWERRYGAVTPVRTPGNRRLYSDDDVRRLLLLRRALESGWQISQVARLEDRELEKLIGDGAADASAAPERATRDAATTSGPVSGHLERCVRWIHELDGEGLLRQLEQASVDLNRVELIDRLVVPLIEQVGRDCAEGRMRTANEHLVSAVLRSFLDSLHAAFPASEPAPTIVVTTPAGQHHELGALLVAAIARMEGWRTTYLGPNLPAEEIVAAVRRRRAKVLALSIAFPGDDPNLPGELRRLGGLLEDGETLLVGGGAARSYQSALDEVRATRLQDLAELRAFLRADRLPSPGPRS
jgi:DNA-binding transcriptional MerR regulator/methylmalonyl-CoA mutase cobalamin-binding subunit